MITDEAESTNVADAHSDVVQSLTKDGRVG